MRKAIAPNGTHLKPVVSYDPSSNVLLLVEAAVGRLNDLREAEVRRVNDLNFAEVKRIDDLRDAETKRINEQFLLRAEFAKELNIAEAKRIDAIRAVDVNAVSVANERATAQAAVLANQVITSAETLRSLVASTAAAQAQSAAQTSGQILDRLGVVEKSQNENMGKARVSDPMMADFMAEMKTVMLAQTKAGGKGDGINWVGALIVGAVSLLAGLLGIAGVLYAVLKP